MVQGELMPLPLHALDASGSQDTRNALRQRPGKILAIFSKSIVVWKRQMKSYSVQKAATANLLGRFSTHVFTRHHQYMSFPLSVSGEQRAF